MKAKCRSELIYTEITEPPGMGSARHWMDRWMRGRPRGSSISFLSTAAILLRRSTYITTSLACLNRRPLLYLECYPICITFLFVRKSNENKRKCVLQIIRRRTIASMSSSKFGFPSLSWSKITQLEEPVVNVVWQCDQICKICQSGKIKKKSFWQFLE